MRWGWTGYLWQRIFVWFLQQIERIQYHLRVPSRGDIRECLDRRPAKEVVHKRQVFRIQSHLANNNFSKWISRQNIKGPCNAPKMKAENQEQQDTAADPCGRDFFIRPESVYSLAHWLIQKRLGDLIGVTLIPKRCWLCCWCWSWFWWKHHKLGDGWLFSSPMSYYVHSFDISHCRRLFEALQCCTIAICCNFAHLRCEGDTRVVEEAIVLKGKVAPAENKNKII